MDTHTHTHSYAFEEKITKELGGCNGRGERERGTESKREREREPQGARTEANQICKWAFDGEKRNERERN